MNVMNYTANANLQTISKHFTCTTMKRCRLGHDLTPTDHDCETTQCQSWLSLLATFSATFLSDNTCKQTLQSYITGPQQV